MEEQEKTEVVENITEEMPKPPEEAEIKKEKVVSVRMKPEDYAKVKRYAESSNKTVTQVMQEGVTKLIDEDK